MTKIVDIEVTKESNKILNYLNEKSIKEILLKDALAIRIPNFLRPTICKKLALYYEKHPQQEKYTTEVYVRGKLIQQYLGVLRVGTPYNLTYGKEKTDPIYQQYYRNGRINTQQRELKCFPDLEPIEKLRLNLERVYKNGALIANFKNQQMFAGIGRITLPNAKASEIQPHCDSLPEEYQLEGQLGANFYLEVPEQGGELEVWDMNPLTPIEIKNMNENKKCKFESIKSYRIKPERGDLIIINTRRPHAIRIFTKGKRISLNTFIGYKENNPLFLWA